MSDNAIGTAVPDVSRTGFAKLPLRQVITASTATTGLSDPAPAATLPAAGLLATNNFPFVRFLFGGTTTANQTINYQITLWYAIKTESGNVAWIPTIVAKGVATLGAGVMPALIVAANGKIADTLTDTISANGTVVWSPASDRVAWLKLATNGAAYLSVETDVDTAVTAEVYAQLCDN